MFLLLSVLCVAVAALVASHRAEQPVGNWVFKPIASTAMVALGALAWDGHSALGAGVLSALAAFWVSDMLLIPRGKKASFVAGMVAAFVGHALYIRTFSAEVSWVALGCWVVLLPGLGLVWRWLEPHLEGPMRAAVPAYALVFATMASCAVSYAWQTDEPLVAAGALVFMVSDLAVARHRFVKAEWFNKLWGLPLYYAGQAMLALSVA